MANRTKKDGTDKGKTTEMRRYFSVGRGPVMLGDFVTVHGLPACTECSLKVPGGGGDEEAAVGWLWAGFLCVCFL